MVVVAAVTAPAIAMLLERPDLAPSALPHVKAPTLLIVGGYDMPVMRDRPKYHIQARTDERLLLQQH
ncbi:hypothetical protein [Anabaena subtropica]|uniref:hypothetical protein n=1 Tax=Anabaena subtropica TaxID=425380 RepID=UPI001F55642E|nr:hypothetical protein [Anabaena subtropica]